MVAWVASNFRFLWIMLLWTWMYPYLYNPCFQFFLFIPRSGKCGIIWQFWDYLGKSGHRFLIFFKNCHTVVQSRRYFTFPAAMHNFSTFLQTLVIVYFLDNGCLNGCEVESHYGETGALIISIFFRWENKSLGICLRSSGRYMAHADF